MQATDRYGNEINIGDVIYIRSLQGEYGTLGSVKGTVIQLRDDAKHGWVADLREKETFNIRTVRVEGCKVVRGGARPARFKAESKDYDRLVELLKEKGEVTSFMAQKALSLDGAAIRPLLHRLVTDSLAEKQGQKRGTKYVKIC